MYVDIQTMAHAIQPNEYTFVYRFTVFCLGKGIKNDCPCIVEIRGTQGWSKALQEP